MRRINSALILLMLSWMVSSCIKPFDPDIQSSDVQKYVVTGQITDVDGFQFIKISKTSPVGDPQDIPVPGCSVRILDDKGNSFNMIEKANSNYTAFIDSRFLVPGTSFKIDITTPSGENISSDFDQMGRCPEIDSVYYEKKDLQITNTGKTFNGIQFFIDLKGAATDSRNFRWEATETWEYHSDYPLQWYYDGEMHHVYPPDYSLQVCWTTASINTIFTLSTGNLVENKYAKLPLNFLGSNGPRLLYGYSLLIKQYALSEAAYNYWDQLRTNSTQQGGLYQQQPLTIKGNLHNITNPKDGVLGFFGVSSVKTKRVFIQNVPGLEVTYTTPCVADTLGWGGLSVYLPSEYPIYLAGNAIRPYNYVLSKECVDCRSRGGNTVKPPYWPN